MINLLPPDIKEQIRYAKMNRLALRYLRVLLLVVVVLSGIFVGSFYLLDQQAQVVAADVADKQQTIAEFNRTFVPKAKDASERLNAIKYVQDSQTKFSVLIADIAKLTPQGVSIDSMTLTGEDKKPVRIQVSSRTYDDALAFRNALAGSTRVAGADIESINRRNNPPYSFQMVLVVGFKAGQAK